MSTVMPTSVGTLLRGQHPVIDLQHVERAGQRQDIGDAERPITPANAERFLWRKSRNMD